MEVLFLRNATLIIRAGGHQILLDPMLADQGELPPLAVWRHQADRNPLVPLPQNATAALDDVTIGLITHCRFKHVDHLDGKGMRLLRERNLPTFCCETDARYLRKRGIDARPLVKGKRQPFLEGHITLVPARHGHGWICALMGPGVGFLLELPDEPSLYIAGDTVLTDDVRHVLTHSRPDVAVVAAGHASVDIGNSILMSLDEVIEFVRLAPGRTVANHLEALNHCPVTRKQLGEAAAVAGLDGRLEIPMDGDAITFERSAARPTSSSQF